MPRNPHPNAVATDGFGLEVDGLIKSQHPTAEAAAKVALELKQKYPCLQVKVFDATKKTHTVVELATEAKPT